MDNVVVILHRNSLVDAVKEFRFFLTDDFYRTKSENVLGQVPEMSRVRVGHHNAWHGMRLGPDLQRGRREQPPRRVRVAKGRCRRWR